MRGANVGYSIKFHVGRLDLGFEPCTLSHANSY